MNEIKYEEFERVELRVGTIIEVNEFPEARKPAFKLKIDLGEEIGIKESSAQITENYTKEELVGEQILCVCNLGNEQIGPFTSQVLTTGFEDEEGNVVLSTVDKYVPNGKKIY